MLNKHFLKTLIAFIFMIVLGLISVVVMSYFDKENVVFKSFLNHLV